MRKSFLILSAVFYFLQPVAIAQNLPHTLLWRISGNGLPGPSYLYGTIHLTDERLFNLTDSLYNAIEQTQGFAIEVNPEMLTTYLINEIKTQIKNKTYLKDFLSKKEYDKYSRTLSKKLKKPAETITTNDIFNEKNKWISDRLKKGKMSSILDAYLFDIARRQGKWTGGVEDIEDQAGLINNLVDESDIRQIALNQESSAKDKPDDLIKFYLDADLNAIDSMSNTSDSLQMDALLIRRNIKMARRMDSISRVRNMVFAVGAAHLPGNKGLIALLRAKGFNVDPVISKKKILPKNYVVKEVNIPWNLIKGNNDLYSVEMPGKAGDLDMYGVMNMKVNYDIFNSVAYMTTAMVMPFDKGSMDSVVQLYATNLFHVKNALVAKKIFVNGIEGREMDNEDDEGYKHGYVLFSDHVIYVALAIAMKKEPKQLADVSHFLSSLQVFKKSIGANNSMITYKDSIHGFQLLLPSPPQSANDLVDSMQQTAITTGLKISIDKQTGTYFMFSANEANVGYNIENDSTSAQSVHASIKAKFSKITLDTFYFEDNFRKIRTEGKLIGTDVFCKTFYQFYGNRYYALLAMYDSSKANTSVDAFFKSFKMLPYLKPEWKRSGSDDSSISVWVPGQLKFTKTYDSTIKKYTGKYQVYDKYSASTYTILITEPNQYYWRNSDTALWKNIIKQVSDDGKIIKQQYINNNGIKGFEYQLREPGSKNIKREEILLINNKFYTLLTFQPEEEINNENVNTFFKSFTFNKELDSITIFKSKAALLLNDLSSIDSATREFAANSLAKANFDKGDLPLLFTALVKKYEANNDPESSMNNKLADVISSLNDPESISIAKEIYLKSTNDTIKNLLLDIIIRESNASNINILATLLIKSPPGVMPSFAFIKKCKDSMALSQRLIADILPLISDSVMRPMILELTTSLLDSNCITIKLLDPYYEYIKSYSDLRKKLLIKNIDNYDLSDKYLIKVIAGFNNNYCNSSLKEWLAIKNSFIKMNVLNLLMKNNQQLDPSSFISIAADTSYRIELYNNLKKYSRLNVYPKKFLNQRSFAECLLSNGISEKYDVNKMEFLSTEVLNVEGKKNRYFFFKLLTSNGDAKRYHLGCAGPYSLDPLVVYDDNINYSILDDVFNLKLLNKQKKEIVKQLKD